MKLFYLLFSFYILLPYATLAQGVQTSPFDKSIEELTNMLASKLQNFKSQKIAVWELSNLDGDPTPIGKYIAEDISIFLSDKFHIVNRNQLNTLCKENKLSKEGLINQVTLQQLKKLSDIEIIITGLVTVLTDHIKITLEALDADGNIVASSKGDVPMNDDVRELLDITGGSSSASTNRGFNHSLNSNEQINNPGTVNKECETKNSGDYCIMNSTGKKIMVTILAKSQIPSNYGEMIREKIIISVGETKCFLDMEAIRFEYSVYSKEENATNDLISTGQLLVEKCKSKTLIAK